MAVVALSLLSFAVGCVDSRRSLDDEYIIYPSYWGRHFCKVADDFHSFRIDIDRTVFGLEDIPVEEQD